MFFLTLRVFLLKYKHTLLCKEAQSAEGSVPTQNMGTRNSMNEFPLIGLTSYETVLVDRNPPVRMSGSLSDYKNAVIGAGGIPVLIPINTDKRQLSALLDRLDGLILVGGGDIHPRQYRQDIIEGSVYGIDEPRDEMELFLGCEAVARNMPMLAICRGHQVLNVTLGGTLWQDVASMMPGGMVHSYFGQGVPRNETSHTVKIEPNSRLASLLDAHEIAVNTIHHQGIAELAPGLTVSAVAPDGLIEGVEMADKRFVVGVQWHPECLVNDMPQMRGLFEGLVEAASKQ